MESINSITGILITNSFIIVGFILNQNDSAKDAISQNSSSNSNPLEIVTWGALILQFILLLIKIKINEF